MSVAGLYQSLLDATNGNPAVAGALGLYGLGVATFLLRNAPLAVSRFLLRQCTTTLTVCNSDAVYYDLLRWLADRKTRPSLVRELSLNNMGQWCGESVLSLGYGSTLFLVGHTPVLARKTKDKEGAASLGLAPRESVTLTALGRGHGVFLRLKAEVDDHARGRKGIRAHVWKASGWQSIGRVGTRDPASLALPAATLARLMGHVDSFLSDRGWRADRGMPWRTGVLLSGPPGTGKSSLARALCSRLCKDMYVVDLSAMNDQTLRDAMDSVPEGCVVVMEDLDAAGLGRETTASDKPETRLTLSGVLNAVDGAASGEGRILLATTNRPESLDSALVRDGRFDLRLELGLLETGPMREYLARVYPGLEGLDEWEARPGVAPCTLQRLCLEHKSEPLKVLEQVATRTGETG